MCLEQKEVKLVFFKAERQAFLFVKWPVVVTDMPMIINRTERSKVIYPDYCGWKMDQYTWAVLLRQKFIWAPSEHRPQDPQTG